MKRSAWGVAIFLAAVAPATAQVVEPPPTPTPFDRGSFGLSGGGGPQTTFGYRKFVVGVGVGYFVLNGVEIGLSGLHQFGDGPSVSELSPSLRYVAQPLVGRSPLIPYIGVFYRHWFIGSEIDDVDTVGARAGALFLSGRIILGLGVVVEQTVSMCSVECAAVYPEFTIGFSF